MIWQPIESAPKDGSPVWARGHNWGNPSNARHYGWVFFCDGAWLWAEPDGGEATHIDEWLPAAKEKK